jgi:hypothetical protein
MLKDDGWEQVSGPRVTRPQKGRGFLLGEDIW